VNDGNILRRVGDRIQTIFSAEDFLGALPKLFDLWDQRFRPHPSLHITQKKRFEAGNWRTQSAHLSSALGLSIPMQLDEPTTLFVESLSRTRTVREAFKVVAESLDIESVTLEPRILEITAQLIQNGAIVPI
jgi:hypothetical protein